MRVALKKSPRPDRDPPLPIRADIGVARKAPVTLQSVATVGSFAFRTFLLHSSTPPPLLLLAHHHRHATNVSSTPHWLHAHACPSPPPALQERCATADNDDPPGLAEGPRPTFESGRARRVAPPPLQPLERHPQRKHDDVGTPQPSPDRARQRRPDGRCLSLSRSGAGRLRHLCRQRPRAPPRLLPRSGMPPVAEFPSTSESTRAA